MTLRFVRGAFAATTLTAACAFAAVSSGGVAQAATAQSFTVPCTPSAEVTPALDTNLISNPGAEATIPFPTTYGLSKSQANEQEPDCWTISSQSTNPGGIMSALPYQPSTSNGQSSKPANPTTSDPNKGSNLFYGGISTGPTSADSNVFSYGTQTIDLSSINPAGQPFLLSAYLGGTTTQSDTAQASVTFENASGQALDPNVPFAVGPATPALRKNITSLLPFETTGVVPAGAIQAVVTITMEQIGAGPADDDGMADDLDLTIGPSVTPTPSLATLPYSFPANSGGGLTWPAGVSAANGIVYVSNTGDNVVAAIRSGNTSIIAGTLEGQGEAGDGGPATLAELAQPGGTAEDSKGDIFVADTADNVVREITPDGMIHRFAGTGTEGSSGLGGPATQAELDFPEAVAVNATGDVYITDTFNNRVLEVLPDGTIQTVAGNGFGGYRGDGGPGGQAELSQPTGVALDEAGNLYIADAANNVIRRVDAATGTITTVAGDYAADQSNNGLGGFSGDGGAATAAQLYDPEGVALDSAGDLFIADTFNNAIREVTPNGTISTVVNSAGPNGSAPLPGGEANGDAASSELNGPTALAVDGTTDTLYVADTSNSKVAAVIGVAKSGSARLVRLLSGQPGAELPETSVTVAMPLLALGLAGGFVVLRRRRGTQARTA